jgi:hypothetical protein
MTKRKMIYFTIETVNEKFEITDIDNFYFGGQCSKIDYDYEEMDSDLRRDKDGVRY